MATTPANGLSEGPTDPNVSSEEVVERARSLVPLLIAQQEETERRTFYSHEIHEAFVDAGLYLITQPRRYGGYEFPLDTFFKVIAELARGCPSTAWCYALGSGHTIAFAAYWPEEVQDDILSRGPLICPATFKPQGSARRVDGGWRITGTFNYCSGSPYANHFWSHTFAEDELGPDGEPLMLQFIIPRSEWTRLDDWGTSLGMKGSGSHSIRIEDGFVPDLYVMENSSFMLFEPSAGTPGAALHGNSLYNGRPAAWFTTEFTALAVGMARGAMDLFTDLMETKQTPFPPIILRREDYDYQLWYGEAIGKIAVAEAILDKSVRIMEDKAASGDFSLEDDVLILRLSTEATAVCWDVVSRLVARTAGSSEIQNGTRMERIYRDFTQLNTHTGYVLEGDASARDLARIRFGVDASPMMRSFKA